jgi:hypothetical protein
VPSRSIKCGQIYFERNPNHALRNTNDLYDSAHQLATVKSCPLFSYPSAWNEESIRKFNPSPKFKKLKAELLANLAG